MRTAETPLRRRRLAARAHERRRCDPAPTKATDTEDRQEIASSGQHRLQSSTTNMEDDPLHQLVARSIHPTDTIHTLRLATTRSSPHTHIGKTAPTRTANPMVSTNETAHATAARNCDDAILKAHRTPALRATQIAGAHPTWNERAGSQGFPTVAECL